MLQLRLKSFLQFRIQHIEVRLLMFHVTTFLPFASIFSLAVRKLKRTEYFLISVKELAARGKTGLRFPLRTGNVLFTTVSREAVRPTDSRLRSRALLQAVVLWIHRPVRIVDVRSPCSASVKNAPNFISTSATCIHVAYAHGRIWAINCSYSSLYCSFIDLCCWKSNWTYWTCTEHRLNILCSSC